MDREHLIERIMNGFNVFEGDRGVKPDGGRSWWTRKIKTLLCELGNELGCYTCASLDKELVNNGEWLFDVTWLDWNDKLYSVPMVAECEQGNRYDIRDDFQKLLVARADVRLIVCDAGRVPNDSRAERTVNLLCEWIDAFKGTQLGDTYLLVAWERDKNSQRWHSHRYRISVTGEGADARLMEPSRLPVD